MNIFFLVLSLICFAAALLNLVINLRSFQKFFTVKKTTVVLALTFCATLFLFIPFTAIQHSGIGSFQVLFVAIKNTLQVFSLDADFTTFAEVMRESTTGITQNLYITLGAIYNVFAPVITFGFIISVFNNLISRMRFDCAFFKHAFIFSELSEETLCLAKSCLAHEKHSVLVFCDVFEENDESSFELRSSAHALGAICYQHDITKIKIRFPRRFKSIRFFVTGADNCENTHQSVNLIHRFEAMENVSIHLLFDSSASEPIINSIITPQTKCRIRKKNVIRSYLDNYFYNHCIFEDALEANEEGLKQLNIAIFGFGNHGKELLKTYCWCAQNPDYELNIHVFDIDPSVEDTFYAECPALAETSGKRVHGDAYYNICFHTGVAFHTRQMFRQIDAIGKISCAYICFGNDEMCLNHAIELRQHFRKSEGYEPAIKTIVYSPVYYSLIKNNSLKTYNEKEKDYNIEIFCNLNEVYSYDSLLNGELEYLALAKHLDWYRKNHADAATLEQKASDFYKYTYYYHSSIAGVMRFQSRYLIDYAHSQTPFAQRSEQDNEKIRFAEHLGWNAFMRTEGYTYAKHRSVVAKTHYDLIPFAQLSAAEQAKDDDFDFIGAKDRYLKEHPQNKA